MGIGFAKLTDTYPIMNLQGSTWTTREISGADCLQMAINANANNNIFILQPTNISGNNGYTILSGKIDSENAYLFDENSGYGNIGGYPEYGGYRNNSGISRPDLRGIRLSGASGTNANYSGNVNGNQATWNSNTYTAFAYSDQIGYDILIYLPSSVTNILINDAPLITYDWQSVPAISGKNGILSLSTAEDSYHTGDTVTSIPISDVSLSAPSKLSTLAAGIPNGETVSVIYAGSIDHMDITPQAVQYTVSLILAGQSVYSVTPNRFPRWLGFIIDEENEVAKLVWYTEHREADILIGYNEVPADATAEEMHDIWRWIHSHIEGEDPETNEPDEGTDPDYQPDVAVTGITKPGYGAYDTGFTTQYRMSDTQLKSLAQFLWSDNFLDNVKKFFNDPREIIVGLSIMPVIPDTGESKEVKAGGISTGVNGLPLTDQYKLDTYGSVSVKAEKGNFLDYNPFTKVTAHLPFVGEHSLDVNDVMGKTLTLKYIFDFLTGSCVAEIDVDGKPRYFFGGSCGLQVPTSSEDFGRMYSAVVSAGATLGSTLATIATGGLTAPLMVGSASNMLANGMNSSPTVQFSSGSGSVNGMIGCKSAFLVIEKPIEKVAGDQNKFVGKPSYIKRNLKTCEGYTKCMSVHLDNVPCTGQERSELERLLTAGVRISKSGSSTPEYTQPSPSMHGIIFMKLWSDMDVIGKTWNETTELINGQLLFDQGMSKPKFIVDGNYSAYNYAYIPEFNRFYYIMEQSIKSNSMTEIDLQVDVLQSFKVQLIGEDADVEVMIERQQSLNNAYFSDSMYWTQANKIVKTVPFTKANGDALVFEIPEDNFILTIAGGE